MKAQIKKLIERDPETYIPLLKQILRLHDENPLWLDYKQSMKDYPDMFKKKDFMSDAPKGVTSGFRAGNDISLGGGTINALMSAGVITSNLGSNKHKQYGIINPADIHEVVDDYEYKADMAKLAQNGDVVIPKDMFDVVSGFEKVKKLFMMSIKSEIATNILMVGPYATAKTVILQEIDRLAGSRFAMGGLSTKAGLRELLLDEKPHFLLYDEVDEVDRKDWSVLLGLMEDGMIIDTRYKSRRAEKIDCRVYMATNDESKIPKKILSRFGKHKLYFQKYTEEEYEQIVFNVLTKRMGKDPELALYIAGIIVKQSRDVRDAISIGKLAKTKDDVDFQLTTLDEYAKDPNADKKGW